MKIAVNILVIIIAAFGAFLAIAPYVHESAYALFAPPKAEILFPYDKDTIASIYGSLLLTSAQILFLAVVTLWVRRWKGWQDYTIRLVMFVGSLLASIIVFTALGYAYRQLYAGTELRVYAHRLPVDSSLLGMFLTTVALGLCIRFYHVRKTRNE